MSKKGKGKSEMKRSMKRSKSSMQKDARPSPKSARPSNPRKEYDRRDKSWLDRDEDLD